MQFVEKDPHLNDEQKKVLKERVNNRKKIIEKGAVRTLIDLIPDHVQWNQHEQSQYGNDADFNQQVLPKEIVLFHTIIVFLVCISADYGSLGRRSASRYGNMSS